MPRVDSNAPLVTNSDAAMWREDHESAIRYIEALEAEIDRLRPLAEVDEAFCKAVEETASTRGDAETTGRACRVGIELEDEQLSRPLGSFWNEGEW